MRDSFKTLARYNRWANERLFGELQALSPDDLSRTLPVNFGSIMGVLNHVLLADRLWLSRFTGEGEAPARIDETPYPALSALTEKRLEQDARIISFADAMREEAPTSRLLYRDTSGTAQAGGFGPLVMHFFNHQTHHRGQVHALLGGFGIAPRDLDLGFYLRENGL